MKLFKAEPQVAFVPPEGVRDDIVQATSAAPRGEMKELIAAAPQLQYLSRSLCDQEPVRAVASCFATQRALDSGIIALTNRRVVAGEAD